MEKMPISNAYRLIEPGPVALLTTFHNGKNNIMTFSWHMVVDYEPPLFALIIGPWDDSFKAFLETGECTIAVPTVEMATKVIEIGNTDSNKIDKFETFNLTPLQGEKVKSPLIKECLANFECKLEDKTLGKKYGLYIVKVVEAWIDPKHQECKMVHYNGNGTLTVDGETLNMKDKFTKWPIED